MVAVPQNWGIGSKLSIEPERITDGPRRGRKFYLALACYAAIAVLAAFTLDGKIRWVVWIFMAWLAFRTYLETLRQP
jgi:hypothetical protein